MSELPRWIWDVIADLIDYEDTHPKADDHQWCIAHALRKVPAEVRRTAEAISGYRHTPSNPDRPDRRLFTDGMAAKVAEVYVANIDGGSPTKAVKEHFGIATSTASLYVKRSRVWIDKLLDERAR